MELYKINIETSKALEMEEGEEKEYLLSQLNLNLEQTVEELTKTILNQEAHAVALQTEAKRLTEKADIALQRAERVKGYILDSMVKNGLKKAEFTNFTVAVAKTPPRVVVDNEVAIPAEYWVTKEVHSVDKKKLKEAIQEKGEVEGAHLEQGESLRIK